ncbi:FAD/NAD-binding family oxidoreductase [Croceivirga lutea]|uniref:flavodoxin reductase n=1 Tax=Croceivirga lutea TaxID=1775167 RepID=UPI00163A07BB|nr:flavodoxin reductase [Croceivirga lutea]GGG42111.1 FAD/NAD-binding family oxidoreductase [Croceivirga lutea]
MEYNIKVQETGFITPDVLRIKTERPSNYSFTPGQATEVAIDQEGWRDKKRPFTFTSLPDDGFLEFTIKVYPKHKGVTDKIQTVEAGENLIIGDSWGAIKYKGPGVFIAGGAGITPFLSIFKKLEKENAIEDNQLLFANKREGDIIEKAFFDRTLANDFTNILSEEKNSKYEHSFINADFIKRNADLDKDNYYLCGPELMMKAILKDLEALGISKNKVVMEDFS